MKKWQYSLAAALWLSVASTIAHGEAHGESYPNKKVTLVVTAAPGGVTDILARVLGERLGKIWGQPVVVENKPGASNEIGDYKGATPALTDVIAGHIQLMFINTSSAIQPWQAGEVKLLAVGSGKRLARFPDIPTVAEGGLPGFEAVSWFGLFAPGGTAQDVVARVNADVRHVFADAEFREKFLDANMFEPMASSPEQFSAFIKSDAQKWRNVINIAKVKLD